MPRGPRTRPAAGDSFSWRFSSRRRRFLRPERIGSPRSSRDLDRRDDLVPTLLAERPTDRRSGHHPTWGATGDATGSSANHAARDATLDTSFDTSLDTALDTPLDFDHLRRAGSSLGSGAVVVVAAARDMLALAYNVTRFFRNESCGKCVPCRVGSEKAVTLLEQWLAGQAPANVAELLRELDRTLAQTSICGLGQVALVPLVSVLDRLPPSRPPRAP